MICDACSNAAHRTAALVTDRGAPACRAKALFAIGEGNLSNDDETARLVTMHLPLDAGRRIDFAMRASRIDYNIPFAPNGSLCKSSSSGMHIAQ
jgi:hypothetical protein